MKNICIVSAVGHYENAIKYLSENNSNDENHLIIFMYTKGVVPEKILTSKSAHFWEKAYIFEPEKTSTTGMNPVRLNKSIDKFKKFLEDNDLATADQIFMGVLPVLPMYNFIPGLYKDSKINLIEDGTASYMLGDEKIYQYMVAPQIKSMNRNKKQFKKRINRKENGLMLLNSIYFGAFGSTKLAQSQFKTKWNSQFKFNKIILTDPKLMIETPNIQFDHAEQFDFGNTIDSQEVNYNPDGIPIYFDQNFGIPASKHARMLDKIFVQRGVPEVIIKLHPKSKQGYINGFTQEDIQTKFRLEFGNISGEDYIRQSCPNVIYGLNSTVLLNARNVVKIEFILHDYFKLLTRADIESNYYRLMFMNHTSYNLEKIINPGNERLYDLKCSKLVLMGLRKPLEQDISDAQHAKEDLEDLEGLEFLENKSKYLKKLEANVRRYMIVALRTEVNEKQIFFEAYKGRYACSPKELYLYMKNNSQFADYTFVWSRALAMDLQSQILLDSDPRTIIVNYGKPEYFEQLAKSKLIITNQRLHTKFGKKEGQYVIQTWHGTPFKRDAMSVTASTHNVNAQRRLEVNHHDVKNYDYFLVQNEFSAVELAKTFMLENYPDVEVLKTGYPRNAQLVKPTEPGQIETIKKKYGIPLDKKILFYTPTWRDHHKTNKAGINDIFSFDKWQEELSDDWVILFRGHYFHAKSVDLEQYQGFIYDMTKYNDINEFYLISDLLVTDYSSSFFDFLNLKRPIIFHMPDFVAYIKLSRKLHFVPEQDLPGPVSYATDEFIQLVKNYEVTTKPYVKQFDQYIAEFCPWDKNASETVIKQLQEKNVL